jgi:hypothetical protein
MGIGAETLPFDWMCTRIEGVIGFLSSDFQGFFNFTSKESTMLKQSAHAITVFRATYHSFWHDDPTDAATQEKYRRRITRFLSMRADSEPMLFVRLLASSEELPKATSLLQGLMAKFGQRAMLLVIVGGQRPDSSGPYVIDGLGNLLVFLYQCGQR